MLVLLGGLVGAGGAFLFQWWASAIAYPLNIGGRPFFSWVAFIVPSFEMLILFAAGAAVLGMFLLNGLPQPYHPTFNVERPNAEEQSRCCCRRQSTDNALNHASTDRRPQQHRIQLVQWSCPDERFRRTM